MYDMDSTACLEHVTGCASAADDYCAAPDGVFCEVADPHMDPACLKHEVVKGDRVQKRPWIW